MPEVQEKHKPPYRHHPRARSVQPPLRLRVTFGSDAAAMDELVETLRRLLQSPIEGVRSSNHE